MIYHGDCLEIMPTLADKSVGMILCDLPYGTTACKWDTIIPFEPLWAQYKRLIKDNGAIVLTASQPFTSALVMSNPVMFKHEWIWEKTRASNFATANYSPLKYHESVVVFGSARSYTPIKEVGNVYCTRHNTQRKPGGVFGDAQLHATQSTTKEIRTDRYPSTIIKIPSMRQQDLFHPTQKPVALFEYLIRTYTNEGETVLDNCAGSFTTAIACINTNRKYICIEKDEKYFEIGKNRIANHQPLLQAVNQ
jgi:site-specific DNA-methyltransferase (adenine-specific)